MQLAPSPYLADIVKHYLILENNNDQHLNYRLFSDGNPGIVFYFKTPLTQYNEHGLNTHVHPRSFIYGQVTRYKDLLSVGKLGILVVVLQPYGIYSLSRIASHELNDSIVSLNDVFGNDASILEDQVLNAPDGKRMIDCIESFLLKKRSDVIYPDKPLAAALKLIGEYKGMITINNLLNVLPVTERQLERKFKEFIGISPKRFTDIVKLQHFLKLLQNRGIANSVYDAGYYDQAHLNNCFKRSIGLTPSQYKANSNLLAINFMQT
jgi:AraC-like DNA-binding protein